MAATMTDHGPRLLRRRDPISRRRSRAQTLAMVLRSALQAVLLVGAPLGLLGWITLSGYFHVDSMTLRVASRVDPAWAETALQPLLGEHILGLSMEDVTGRLEEHPWVAGVEITKELPRRLIIAVDERQPVAVWVTEEERYLDSEGRVIAPTGDDELAGVLPRVRWGGGEPVPVASALAFLEELRSLRPAWVAGLEDLVILADGDYRLRLATTSFELVTRAGTLAEALPRLDRALEEIADAELEVGVVDLRQVRRIVIRPAAATAVRTNPAGGSSSAETEEG